MATKQELFTKVTGLTWDVETLTDKELLSWLVPRGAMLSGDPETNEKLKDTLEFCEAAGIELESNTDGYDDIEDNGDDSSNDDVHSTADVIDG